MNVMKKTVIVFSLLLMSFYPVYRNFYYGRAYLQYERQKAIIEKRSEFYNPWQYRILCPLMIEGLVFIYDHTIDKIYPLEDKIQHIKIPNLDPTDASSKILENFKDPEYVKYLIVFVFFRMLENIFIYILLFHLLKYFVKNQGLIIVGLIYASLALGNSVNDSDLALHTYFDIILFISAGLAIIHHKHWYIIPISILGAMNRETSILIPFIYFISFIDYKTINIRKWNSLLQIWPGKRNFLITAISSVLYLSVFIFIRIYFGYESQTEFKVASGWPMLRFNMFSFHSVKTYMEIYGVLTILPLTIIFIFKHCHNFLKIWFWGLIPIWFAIHFVLVVAYQSRLFLVPTLMIFLPMVLEYIEISIKNSQFNLLGIYKSKSS